MLIPKKKLSGKKRKHQEVPGDPSPQSETKNADTLQTPLPQRADVTTSPLPGPLLFSKDVPSKVTRPKKKQKVQSTAGNNRRVSENDEATMGASISTSVASKESSNGVCEIEYAFYPRNVDGRN